MEVKRTQNYMAWRIKQVGKLDQFTWEEAVEYLLGWGLLAPSSHNMQPWLVKKNEQTHKVGIWPRKKYIGGVSDPTGRQACIGVGCFAGLLELVLTSYGLTVKQQQVNGGIEYDLTDLQSGVLQDEKWLGLIVERKSYRGKFKVGEKFSAEKIAELKRVSKDYGVELVLITDPAVKQAVAEVQELADRAVMMQEDFRHELAEYMRLSDTREERVLPVDTFLMSDDMAVELIAALKAVGQFPGSFADGMARNDFDCMTEASAIGVILVAKEELGMWVAVGKSLVEMWLRINSWGWGVGVTAGMVESSVHRKLLVERLGLADYYPVAVFRMGVPLEQVPDAPRLVRVARLFESD